MNQVEQPFSQRNCQGCTKCCEGYLTASIYEHNMYAGNPCHFVVLNQGCSIYNKRPSNPCAQFKCNWLIDKEIPEWFKPNTSDLIIITSEYEGISYTSVVEAGSPIESKYLNWLILYALNNKKNLLYEVNGSKHWIGSTEFLNAMAKKYSNNTQVIKLQKETSNE